LIANDFLSISIFFYWILRDIRLHQRCFERVGDLNPENLMAYKHDQYQPEEVFKPGFKEKILRFLKDSFKSDKCLINYTAINVPILPSTLSCNSIVYNNFAVCMSSVFIFWWTGVSFNTKSVTSISTDWSIQSKSIKSHLPIFIDWELQSQGVYLRN